MTVLFNAKGQQTEVELIHQGFDNKEAAEHHSQGWTSILDRLGNFL